jgi:CBS domain-containing protein
MVTTLRCKDVMTRELVTCRNTDAADEVARAMRRNNVVMMPVLDENVRLVGVISDRDLALRVLADRLSLDTPVEEVMRTEDLIICREGDNLETVESKLADARKLRALVVADHDSLKLVGILGVSDLTRAEDRDRVGELVSEISKNRVAPTLIETAGAAAARPRSDEERISD